MRFLVDTHLLVWTVGDVAQVPGELRSLLAQGDHAFVFSAASIWEIAIKSALRKPGFLVEPLLVRDQLRRNGYSELFITSDHADAVRHLPFIHRDPFDRILIAQAIVEDLTLLTVDSRIARYPAAVRKL